MPGAVRAFDLSDLRKAQAQAEREAEPRPAPIPVRGYRFPIGKWRRHGVLGMD